MDWVYLLIYFMIQMIIVLVISKKIKTEDDYFLGGRTIPMSFLAFSIFATWFGAETCIGSSSAVFEQGLSGSKAEPIGYGLCLFLTALIIAPFLWSEKYTTLGDFFKEKYGKTIEQLAIWVMIPSSLFWAAAQVRAFGHVISLTTTLHLETAIFVGTLFVVIYTFFGGLMGDIITDLIQGAILAVSLLFILGYIFYDLGGPLKALSTIDPGKLTFISEEQSLLSRLDSWMIPILGSLVAQELIARTLAAKSPSIARKASLWGCGLYLVFGSIPILVGLLGHNFNLDLQHSEQFLPMIAKKTMPSIMFIIFAGALISAILSTIDSILLAVSALVSHNFLVPTFKIEKPSAKVWSARGVVMVSGVICYVLAIYATSVYQMVETASAFGTAGILIITLAGLFLKDVRPLTAGVALITSLILSVLFEFSIKVEARFIFALLGGLGVFFLFHCYFLLQKALVMAEEMGNALGLAQAAEEES